MEFPGQPAKPFFLKSILKPLTVTAMCVMLAGCFGGGGDDDDAPPDTDLDTIVDSVDNCPSNANTDQLDTNDDDQGNVCDTDDDGDGDLDNADNCPLAINADQLDTDGDLQGDACDTDDDNDGDLDSADNCPLVSNADQADGDTDGLGDACDPVEVGGGGIKGPLVNALVTVYELDSAESDFKGAVIDTGTTNDQAQMTGISVPGDAEPPFLLEFTADDDTTDLVTGQAPVITVMRTVLTDAMLSGGEPVYATPLTTMAVDLAIRNADYDGDENNDGDLNDAGDKKIWGDRDGDDAIDTGLGNGTTTLAEFESALPVAATQVKSTVGFGMGADIDIFEASPVLDATTTDEDEQEQAASYRAAVEAVTAIVYQLNEATGNGDSDEVLDVLTADLADGEIDGEVDGEVSEIFGEGEAAAAEAAVQLLSQDPATLPIPNDPDNRTVGDMKLIIAEEIEDMGNDDVVDVEIDTDEEVELKPAEADPDLDDDGTPNDQDVFPNDPAEYRDFDKDGLGDDEADSDDDNDGVSDGDDVFPLDRTETMDSDDDGIGEVADTDDDNDGVSDTLDDFPLDDSKSNAADVDEDGWPSEQDPDDENDAVPTQEYEDTDGDRLADEDGLTPDSDDDNDGVPDEDDAFRTDARYQSDMDGDDVADNDPAETDIDGDGVLDTEDAFKFNPFETQDTDRDGTGNNTDDDDDDDGVSDALEEQNDTDSLKRDTDGDGVLDNVDEAPRNPAVQFDSDKDGEDNRYDNCPLTFNPDQANSDDDERGDACDRDDDNDEINDEEDDFPLDDDESVDTDGDGVGNSEDGDDDGDSIDDDTDPSPLTPDAATDTDGDDSPDVVDEDDDNDGEPDVSDAFPLNDDETDDTDGDRMGDNADTDDDNDGLNDNVDPYRDSRDGDDDGRNDALDNCPTDANSEQRDSDGDRQGDDCDDDDDNDGVTDAEGDNCPLIPNAGQQNTDGDDDGNACDSDLDGDGFANNADNCPFMENDQTDENGNGIGDDCDADADEDGRIDPLDNCPHVPNSGQLNTDKDALGDACDDDDDNDGLNDEAEGEVGTEPLDPDSDDDRVPDGLDVFPLDGTESSDSDEDGLGNNEDDNCPFVSNQDQANHDGDERGDDCDSDDDNDGVPDANDAFPFEEDESVDTDRDGTGNNADTDDDNDGVSDTEELAQHTNPLVADTDGDGNDDGDDNCPVISNPAVEGVQADGDEDGIGDACDTVPVLSSFYLNDHHQISQETTGVLASEMCPKFMDAETLTRVTHWQQDGVVVRVAMPEPMELNLNFGAPGTVNRSGAVAVTLDETHEGEEGGSVQMTLNFQGQMDAAGVITGTATRAWTVSNSEDTEVASCSETSEETFTPMPSMAASDLLDGEAGPNVGFVMMKGSMEYYEEVMMSLPDFVYELIDNTNATEYVYDLFASTWEERSEEPETRLTLGGSGWVEITAPHVVSAIGDTAMVGQLAGETTYGNWEVEAFAYPILGKPMEGLVPRPWSQHGITTPTDFASEHAKALGLQITLQEDYLEVRCHADEHPDSPFADLTCKNGLVASMSESGEATLASSLGQVIHAADAEMEYSWQGIRVGGMERESGRVDVMAFLRGADASGAEDSTGSILYYAVVRGSDGSEVLEELPVEDGSWVVIDPNGDNSHLMIEFSFAQDVLDMVNTEFDDLGSVIVAVIPDSSDSQNYLRVGSKLVEGTVFRQGSLNHPGLEEVQEALDYYPNIDKDEYDDASDPDEDNDGVSDEEDAFPYNRYEQLDSDGDEEGNNKDQDDDNDGIGDYQEINQGTDPLITDTDEDGHDDGEDNCPATSNEDQADTDEDGVGDACEESNVTITDTDSDGVIDDLDAFDDEATEQFDTDGDGTGDNSDDCPFTPESTCADPGVNMDGLYLVHITNIAGQELNKISGSCETITETTAYFIARITQTGNQIKLVNMANPSSDFDAGTVDSTGDFALYGIATDSEFTGNFNSSNRTLTGSYTETTGTSCVQTGDVTAIPGADVTENTVGASGVAWFDGGGDASMYEYEYGVVSETGETGFTYDYDASDWLADSTESEYFLTSSGVTELDDSYIISGYVSAGETAIINPTVGGVANTSVNEHLVLNSVDLNGIPMPMLVRGYESALGETSTFTTGATGYLASIESTSDTYRFWCDDDWNDYVVNTYTCANIVAKAWDDLDDTDGNHDDPVAATSLDDLVATPTEMANIQTVSGSGIWAGEGYDAAQYHINGYLVSDDGTLAGSNLKMVFVKSYWISNQHFTIGETAVETPVVGGAQVVQWEVPELVRRLGNQDWEDYSPFLFVESDLDSTPLVRRGNRDLAGRVNYELLFNITAKDQVLGEFAP